ncbi:DUF2147 domain-containing protein [Phaeodactylibacter sp.]|uniref:DUF2147 domain-containing protein n=1 Tax=Phaeodactylibacter sp. TaxID=1940289 RepID=UPI0025E60E52|nr:DUF2147 domain-containing protein [Phaeodactylibacter sp.]MCI4651194.1 DUF2147 domain-containing protein [Phaeodactylibacter sp.]MCI5090402.1 DUF2147 domain-containing protein [Phaeodactylibacter sp.]
MTKSIFLTFSLAILTVGVAFGQDKKADQKEADRLIGVWAPSNGRALVKVQNIAGKYYGRIVKLKEPIDPETGEPKLDKNNPDESLRDTPLLGYRMLKDFVYVGDDEWTEGTIYDPLSGSLYSCTIKMKKNGNLDIRGYIGVKALGRTDVWTRVK